MMMMMMMMRVITKCEIISNINVTGVMRKRRSNFIEHGIQTVPTSATASRNFYIVLLNRRYDDARHYELRYKRSKAWMASKFIPARTS